MSFKAWSPVLTAENFVPKKYVFNSMGCEGLNISPPVEWSEAPLETKSFALTVFDPDAPKIGGWWHWTVVNIPANVTKLEEGASNQHTLPKEAKEIETNYGDVHYGGPCPPKGDSPHHYIFTVYALKHNEVHVTPNSTPASLKLLLERDSLAKSSFTVEYGR